MRRNRSQTRTSSSLSSTNNNSIGFVGVVVVVVSTLLLVGFDHGAVWDQSGQQQQQHAGVAMVSRIRSVEAFISPVPSSPITTVSKTYMGPNQKLLPLAIGRSSSIRTSTGPGCVKLTTQDHSEQQQQQQQDDTNTAAGAATAVVVDLDEITRLKDEAERIRLQADQMDLNLTLEKIDALEDKLNNRSWLDRHPDAERMLRDELQRLTNKYAQREGTATTTSTEQTKTTSTTSTATSTPSSTSTAMSSSNGVSSDQPSKPVSPSLEIESSTSTVKSNTNINGSNNESNNNDSNNKNKVSPIPPMNGFDQQDLDVYIPVVNDINKMADSTTTQPMTLKERLDLFSTAPEVVQHTQAKMKRLLTEPMEQMQQLEQLKQEYIESSSRTERTNIKRRIDQLNGSLKDRAGSPNRFVDKEGDILIPDDRLPPLTDEEIEQRVLAVQALPDILIAIYLQRSLGSYEASENDDGDSTKPTFDVEKIRSAVTIDYFNVQVALLNNVNMKQLTTDKDLQNQFVQAYIKFPTLIQERFIVGLGMQQEDTSSPPPDADAVLAHVIQRYKKVEEEENSFFGVFKDLEEDDMDSNNMNNVILQDPPEYEDIEFVDRSRYLTSLIPSIQRLEGQHPSEDDVQTFANDILGRSNAFMVTGKPERVMGGYYIRGRNLLEDTTTVRVNVNDEPSNDGKGQQQQQQLSASDRLVEEVSNRLQSNIDGRNLNDRLEFFYVFDPQAPMDEDLLMGDDTQPIFIVTAKNRKDLYQLAEPSTKSLVTLSGISTTLAFCVGSCLMNDRIGQSFDLASSSAELIDVSWFFSLCLPLFGSLGAITLAHEVAHRLVAWYYKFDIGNPNIVPSVSTGTFGTITPIKSPPPNSKALFDFAIAGPLAGFAVSLAFLLNGLELTQHMSLSAALPVLPVNLIRGSSLAGGLVQFFLGKVAILPDQGPDALLELHPFAVAGLIGCLINALAMLPLGHTDGGRICLAMFGRRFAYVFDVGMTIMLLAAGLFGLDDVNILLYYTVFAVIWQKELDVPCLNEVDDLDFVRGSVGVASSLLVGLTLIPML